MLGREYKRILVFDMETSGLSAEEDQPIEIAALVLEGGRITREFDEFVKMKSGLLDQKITELTGITNEMLATLGSSESEVAIMFFDIINSGLMPGDKVLLMAHNAGFDLSFMYAMFNRCGLKLDVAVDAVDTVTVYKDRASFPHRLESAILHYDITGVKNSHRAIDDVFALFEVIKCMSKERDDLSRYVNLFGYNPKYGVGQNKIDGIHYVPQPFHMACTLYEKVDEALAFSGSENISYNTVNRL